MPVNMTRTFIDLPYELQQRILEFVQQPWHLTTQVMPTYSMRPIYIFVPSMELEAGPIFACRTMHQISAPLIKARFIGLLDMRQAVNGHVSIVVRCHKAYIPKISKVLIGANPGTLQHVGPTNTERFPNLKTIELFNDLFHIELNADPNAFDDVLTTPCQDEAMVEWLSRVARNTAILGHFIKHREAPIQLFIRQVFGLEGSKDELVSFRGDQDSGVLTSLARYVRVRCDVLRGDWLFEGTQQGTLRKGRGHSVEVRISITLLTKSSPNHHALSGNHSANLPKRFYTSGVPRLETTSL